ncbi:condensation domain-containing protein, partial [Alicyclobacillus fodiniaquatilis]
MPGLRRSYYEVSSAQKRMYVLQEMDPQGTAYNMPAVLVVEGELDRERLEWAFGQLVARHESLRTRFVVQGGIPVQEVLDEISFAPVYREGTEAEAEEWAREFVRLFNLGEAPLLRVEVMVLGAERHLLAIDMHHIISDG